MGERGRDVSEKKIEITNMKEAEGRRREAGDGKQGRQEGEINGKRKERGRKCRFRGRNRREKKIIRREDGERSGQKE